MTNKTSSYRDALLDSLTDPVEAAHYLNAAMSDSPEMFLKALRNVAQSRQMAKVAREAGVTRESLYRATSEIGNPTLDTLDSVLTAVGVKIKFEADVPSATPFTGGSSSPRRTYASAPVSVGSSRIQGIGTTVGLTGAIGTGALLLRGSGLLLVGREQNSFTVGTGQQLNLLNSTSPPVSNYDFALNTETANPAFELPKQLASEGPAAMQLRL